MEACLAAGRRSLTPLLSSSSGAREATKLFERNSLWLARPDGGSIEELSICAAHNSIPRTLARVFRRPALLLIVLLHVDA